MVCVEHLRCSESEGHWVLEYHPQEGWSVATSLERDSCLSPAFSRTKAITPSSQLLPGTLILTLSSKTGVYSHLVSARALHEECSGNVEWALKRTKMKVSKRTRVQPTGPKTFALLSFQEEASGASRPGRWWGSQHTWRMSLLSRSCSLWVVQLLSCLSTLVTRNFSHFSTSSGFRLGGA